MNEDIDPKNLIKHEVYEEERCHILNVGPTH